MAIPTSEHLGSMELALKVVRNVRFSGTAEGTRKK